MTAKAKGMRTAVILNRHALKTGMTPIVTIMGVQFTYLMGGAIVVENVFGWNGVGRMAMQAIFQRDYPLIQGCILMFACVVEIGRANVRTPVTHATLVCPL